MQSVIAGIRLNRTHSFSPKGSLQCIVQPLFFFFFFALHTCMSSCRHFSSAVSPPSQLRKSLYYCNGPLFVSYSTSYWCEPGLPLHSCFKSEIETKMRDGLTAAAAAASKKVVCFCAAVLSLPWVRGVGPAETDRRPQRQTGRWTDRQRG